VFSQANHGEDHDGLVTAPLGVSENTTKERCNVDEEGVESTQAEGDLLTLSEGTSDTISSTGDGIDNSTSVRTLGQGSTNVVVVDVCCPIVRPPRFEGEIESDRRNSSRTYRSANSTKTTNQAEAGSLSETCLRVLRSCWVTPSEPSMMLWRS